jgi:hypothetical protein
VIVEKRFWIKESDGIKCALSYSDPRSTKGFCTRLGGTLVEKLSVEHELDGDLMSVVYRTENVELPFRVLVVRGGEAVELLRCETHKIANEVAKALGHCYSVVYVTKNEEN